VKGGDPFGNRTVTCGCKETAFQHHHSDVICPAPTPAATCCKALCASYPWSIGWDGWSSDEYSCRDILKSFDIVKQETKLMPGPKGNRWVEKAMRFEFEVFDGFDTGKCCVVNFVKGTVKRWDGKFANWTQFGHKIEANTPDYEVDSTDPDPNYPYGIDKESKSRCHVTDAPNISPDYTKDRKYKMCVFDCEDVPKHHSGLGSHLALLGKAIKCLDWKMHVVHHGNDSFTEYE